MKRIFYVIACAFIVSCSNSTKERETTETKNVVVNDSPDTTTTVYSDPVQETTHDETKTEETVSSTNSNDWDTALDEYDEYMDKYIKIYKKSKTGDVSAIMESAELMQKAESLSNKLKEAKGQMTIQQMKRFSKIQNKLIQAM